MTSCCGDRSISRSWSFSHAVYGPVMSCAEGCTSYYCNPKTDDLFKQGQSTSDEKRRHEIYDEIQRNRGRVSNILRAQSLDPKSMRAHLDLYMATVFGKGGLSRREAELLAVVVSAANGDQYCLTHHGEGLDRHARDPEWVKAVSKDPTKAKLSER